MDLWDHIDNYCERLDPGLLAEPVNSLSNLSFFIAAWLLCKDYKSARIHDPQTVLLIALVAVVGAGSLLFHTFGNFITMLTDVIPIAIFVFYYLWVSLRRLVRLTLGKTCIALLVFAGLATIAENIPAPYRFNGSVSYFPCLIAVILMTVKLHRMHHPATNFLIKATLWLTISLIFRSIDIASCPWFPLGTHFLWHLCNGVVLFYLVQAILRQPMPVRK